MTGEVDQLEGQMVRFTAGPLGVVRELDQRGFEDRQHNVHIGDEGRLMQRHPYIEAAGWWVVAVGDFLCPAHESQFEATDDRRGSYRSVAHPAVPDPTVRMRERLLGCLRSLTGADAATAQTLAERLRRAGLLDYRYARCLKDLRVLEEAGLVRSAGHPRRWSAR